MGGSVEHAERRDEVTGAVARAPRAQLHDGVGAFANDSSWLLDRPAARGRNCRRHRLGRNGRGDGEEIGIQRDTGVAPQTCVQNALVIKTPDWFSGLLQVALARVRIEGLN